MSSTISKMTLLPNQPCCANMLISFISFSQVSYSFHSHYYWHHSHI
ncbi:MAG: hypothetical protein Q8K60_07595 [Parachlamydiaceae bacterium]|nr:hypothetical protein [Parachlamydiaceae bacterium]